MQKHVGHVWPCASTTGRELGPWVLQRCSVLFSVPRTRARTQRKVRRGRSVQPPSCKSLRADAYQNRWWGHDAADLSERCCFACSLSDSCKHACYAAPGRALIVEDHDRPGRWMATYCPGQVPSRCTLTG